MTIHILHLYYDLMNLYGEIGNIKALKKSLEDLSIKVIIDKLSINDEIHFNKYDLVYIGSGTESNKLMVLNDILKYRKEIKEYIESGKYFISTGNSYELFGKSIDNNEALNIFDYTSNKLGVRLVGDKIVTCDFINKKILGFINSGSIIKDNKNTMFNDEGIHYKNFFGTYLLGPILIRNPLLNKYIILNLIKSKNSKFKLKKLDFKYEELAYNEYMNTYHKED